MKVLFSSFLKSGHTALFAPETEMLEPYCITKWAAPHESTVQLLSRESSHTVRIDSQTVPLAPR